MHIIYKPCTFIYISCSLFIYHARYLYIMLVIYISCSLFIYHARYLYIRLVIYISCTLFIYHEEEIILTQTAPHSFPGRVNLAVNLHIVSSVQ